MSHRRLLSSVVAMPLILLLVASCGAEGDDGGDGAPGSDEEPTELAGITKAHNDARAAVDPPAETPLEPLVWSREVSAAAQAHAEKCVWEHSGGPYGENIFAASERASGMSAERVVGSWVSEAENYDYESDSCSGVCGHYTQVVWAASERLGCAMAKCTEGSPVGSGAWQFWVCNYDPPGNFRGRKPY
ncbi:CAP domain-containing protein [Chondromyces crocatus]|uniref:Fis family transcriptional regulator n=1 Tax=Chondromyces crocatus TaxID=52 RepID=A0A0K1EC78_CHOCO|nr:CAP domain-containing protein [Chondromyces crocatus]AKT38486.1 Fis family transcriptional regulator [Chondromyces crocatus]